MSLRNLTFVTPPQLHVSQRPTIRTFSPLRPVSTTIWAYPGYKRYWIMGRVPMSGPGTHNMLNVETLMQGQPSTQIYLAKHSHTGLNLEGCLV